MANLYRDLQDTWSRDGRTEDARAALRRWADTRPDLARFDDPTDLVTACNQRGGSARILVESLTEEAADPWAARTVLQALLPGLAALAREHMDMVGGAREPFSTVDELDQFIVATAYERITEVAAEAESFRLRIILDSTWARLRVHARAHRRNHDRSVPLRDGPNRLAAPSRTDAEELALVLVDAVERRVLRPVDARLVYTTRVSGHSAAALAETLDWNPDSLVRRRRRVERVLAAEVLGEPRPAGLAAARSG